MTRSRTVARVLAVLVLLVPCAVAAQGAERPRPEEGRVASSPVPEPPAVGPPRAPAEACEVPTGFLLGLHGLLFVPFGPWTDHPMAGTTTHRVEHPDDLDLFGLGGGGILELGAKWCPRVGFSVQFDLSSLGVGGWVDYANANGSSISAWAIQWGVDSLLLVEALREGLFRLEARVGFGYRDGTGRETDHQLDVTYSYDSLRPGFSLRLGAGWLFSLLDGLDAVVLTDFVMGFPGVDFVEQGEALPAWSFQLAAGLRLLPMELR